jgi:nucleoside-diphosphate-sugar epimerase
LARFPPRKSYLKLRALRAFVVRKFFVLDVNHTCLQARFVKALVTGGNGFLGGAIVRMLQARGDSVTVFSRTPPITHSEVPHFPGDIREAESLRKAFSGMDTIFHVAAKAGVWGPAREYQSINVDGTCNVINACRMSGVAKLIYTSSPSVVFGRDDLCGVNESQPYPDRYLAAYPKTKAQAERMVLAANGHSLSTVALRPHLIWGPGDPHLIPRVVARARQGKLRQVGIGTNLVDITYIDNAAEAHVLAADALSPAAPCAGRAYFISQGEPVALWPWLNQLLGAVGAPPVTGRISFKAAFLMGSILESVHKFLGSRSEPLMTRFVANQLAKSHYFDISAANRDLGYVPRVSLQDGMERLIDWLKEFPAR